MAAQDATDGAPTTPSIDARDARGVQICVRSGRDGSGARAGRRGSGAGGDALSRAVGEYRPPLI